jgi:hypothetical protein
LTAVVASDAVSFTIVFAPDRYIPVSSRPHDSPLHLSVDQLRLIDSPGPSPSSTRRPLPQSQQHRSPVPRSCMSLSRTISSCF